MTKWSQILTIMLLMLFFVQVSSPLLQGMCAEFSIELSEKEVEEKDYDDDEEIVSISSRASEAFNKQNGLWYIHESFQIWLNVPDSPPPELV